MGQGAVYKFLMSVDARRSGGYLDGAKLRMRERIYGFAEGAFAATGVGAALIHREDRGDGFLAAVDARVPPAQLVGPWLTEVHQRLRAGNEDLARPLGLRVGMHVGPVTHDAEGIAGEAVDLVCRLADCAPARDVLDASGRDLVCVVSDSLYQAVVRHGGRFMEPTAYRAARVVLKEGPLTAWFHVPGEARPALPVEAGLGDEGSPRAGARGGEPPRADAPPPGADPATAPGSAAKHGKGGKNGRKKGGTDGGGTEGGDSDGGSTDNGGTENGGTENGGPDAGLWDEGGAHLDVRSRRDVFVVDRGVFHGPTRFGGGPATPKGER